MDTVGHYFHGHVVHEVDALHGTFVFIFTAFMESGHRVVEVRGMRISGFIGGAYIFKFGLGMGYRGQDAFSGDVFTELHGSG